MQLSEDQERLPYDPREGPIYLCINANCDYSTYPRGRQYELSIKQRNDRALRYDRGEL